MNSTLPTPPVVTTEELAEAMTALSDIVLMAISLSVITEDYEGASDTMAKALKATFLDGIVYGAAHGDSLREI